MADYFGTDTVVSELREDGLLIIRINRPDMANALNGATSKAMENITPEVVVKSRRVGGSNYEVPIEVSAARGQALALRWLTKYSRERGGKGMAENLANEIMDAANGTGSAVKKREDTHRMAEANKAFAHYKW